jgi:hypothetical protein
MDSLDERRNNVEAFGIVGIVIVIAASAFFGFILYSFYQWMRGGSH